MAARDDDDIETTAAELAETLDDLRAELESERAGPPGMTDLLRFTERYTIPAVIAVLEAAIRTLELLAGSIRLAVDDPEADRRSRTADATLDALDGALREASRVVSGGEPRNERARELLQDARVLREDLDEQLRGRGGAGRSGGTGPDERETGDAEADSSPDGEGRVSIDVESELAAVRETVEEERRAGERFAGAADGDEPTDGDDDGSDPE